MFGVAPHGGGFLITRTFCHSSREASRLDRLSLALDPNTRRLAVSGRRRPADDLELGTVLGHDVGDHHLVGKDELFRLGAPVRRFLGMNRILAHSGSRIVARPGSSGAWAARHDWTPCCVANVRKRVKG